MFFNKLLFLEWSHVTCSTILASFLVEFYWIPQWVSSSERGHNDITAVVFVAKIFTQPLRKVKPNPNCWHSSAHSEQSGSFFTSERILMFHYNSQLSIHSFLFSLSPACLLGHLLYWHLCWPVFFAIIFQVFNSIFRSNPRWEFLWLPSVTKAVRNPFVWPSSHNSVQRASRRRNTGRKKKEVSWKTIYNVSVQGKEKSIGCFRTEQKKGKVVCKTIYNVSVQEKEKWIECVCVLWYLEPTSALRG